MYTRLPRPNTMVLSADHPTGHVVAASSPDATEKSIVVLVGFIWCLADVSEKVCTIGDDDRRSRDDATDALRIIARPFEITSSVTERTADRSEYEELALSSLGRCVRVDSRSLEAHVRFVRGDD